MLPEARARCRWGWRYQGQLVARQLGAFGTACVNPLHTTFG